MKTIIFDKNKLNSNEDFFNDICLKLNKNYIDVKDKNSVNSFFTSLNVILWHYSKTNIKFVFKNFDYNKLKFSKEIEDYSFFSLLTSFEDFIKEHPTNQIKFVDEKYINNTPFDMNFQEYLKNFSNKTFIYDLKKYNNHEDLYNQIYHDLGGKIFPNWKNFTNLYYNPKLLNDFISIFKNCKNTFIFKNFNQEILSLQENYDNFQYKNTIDVFQKFVRENPTNKIKFEFDNDKKEKYVFVNFKDSKMNYIYKTDLNLKTGNIVEAPTLNYVMKGTAIVKVVIKLADWELPIEKNRILKISNILSQEDENGIFDKVNFMLKRIDKNLLKELKKDYENDWVVCWKSNFGYTLSHEQDGVFEVFYFDDKTEDVFEEYTITSKQNFDIKLSFAQTIVSQYFHNTISEETFKELFEKI